MLQKYMSLGEPFNHMLRWQDLGQDGDPLTLSVSRPAPDRGALVGGVGEALGLVVVDDTTVAPGLEALVRVETRVPPAPQNIAVFKAEDIDCGRHLAAGVDTCFAHDSPL